MADKSNLMVQDLSSFSLPPGFRGRPGWYVQLWWIIQATLFATTPQFMYGWRRLLLRVFGAKIGIGVIIRPSVKVTFPWKVSIGDNSWIGDDVTLYSLGKINIGKNVVISQKSYLCTGSHEYTKPRFDIFALPISIEDECWLATDVFVSPGITIGSGTIVGSRSSVFHDLPAMTVCVGTPAKPIKTRKSNGELEIS